MLTNELYPFSTQDGQPIPLEIINPLASVYFAHTTTAASLVLSAKFNLSAIFSTEHCIIDLSNTLSSWVSGTTYNDTLFIPKETIVLAVLPTATIKVRSFDTSGNLFIQGVQKWAAMNLPRQFTGKTS